MNEPPKWRKREDLYWRLDGRTPVKCKDVEEWAEHFEARKRIIAQTTLGPLFVSTVFLGIDHRYLGDGPPLLFETMIFGADQEDKMVENFMERYSTWDEAEAGHARAVEHAKDALLKAAGIFQKAQPPT